MKISLLNELFIFTGTLEKFNLNGSRMDDLQRFLSPVHVVESSISRRSQPVARYLLNHNTASRVKKKKGKKKQNKQLRGNEDCVPFLSTSRHPARGRAAILRPRRRWTPTTDEKSVKSPQKTIHGFTLTDQPPICTPFRFAQSDALRSFHRTIDPWNTNGAEGRRTGVGDNGLRENGTHLFDQCVSHHLLLQRRYRMLLFNTCTKCFSFPRCCSTWLLQLDLEVLIKEYLLDIRNCDYILFLWNFIVSAQRNSSSFI